MQKTSLRLSIAQINPTVGDLDGNSRKIKQFIQKAKDFGADIICFPELVLTGYPPEDLLLKPNFIDDNLRILKKIAKSVKDVLVVIGFVDKRDLDLYNAAALIYKGKIHAVYRKMFLPNYGVFDEKRYFAPGKEALVFKFQGSILGVNICEDIWRPESPLKIQARRGAKLILNINASPYHAGKNKEREAIVGKLSRANKVYIAYVNLIGGQDELVFDGQSMIADNRGRIIARAQAFQEDLLISDINLPVTKGIFTRGAVTIENNISVKKRAPLHTKKIIPLKPIGEVYQALSLGLRDYVIKNGFQKVVIGLSGGIDSSLVAALAVDALGKKSVFGVFMPSQYSSKESKVDASELARKIGIKLINVPIEQIFKAYLLTLRAHFTNLKKDVTEENLQARIRGNILMALSNKFNWLVLTTGNKSEMSTGYATLYGDMAGGLAVIKDVPKMLVYELSRYRNSLTPVIPKRIFTKEPSAELKAHQKDSDTLPVYERLDPILKKYIEEDKDSKNIVAAGFNKEIVDRVLRMVDKSEYKRRQAPPGIKITPKAFGRDRRMPITNKYRG
jgi:NAD+ synthase (glutamine-hydrolysing)